MYPDTHNPVASVAAYKKYGVQKSTASYVRDNYFEIPAHHLNLFYIRYILSWDVDYFFENMKEGTVTRQGVTYRVIYYRTDPTKIKKHKGQILLSFRALQKEYGTTPVVLVTIK